jgi:hypothetical protein
MLPTMLNGKFYMDMLAGAVFCSAVMLSLVFIVEYIKATG